MPWEFSLNSATLFLPPSGKGRGGRWVGRRVLRLRRSRATESGAEGNAHTAEITHGDVAATQEEEEADENGQSQSTVEGSVYQGMASGEHGFLPANPSFGLVEGQLARGIRQSCPKGLEGGHDVRGRRGHGHVVVFQESRKSPKSLVREQVES